MVQLMIEGKFLMQFFKSSPRGLMTKTVLKWFLTQSKKILKYWCSLEISSFHSVLDFSFSAILEIWSITYAHSSDSYKNGISPVFNKLLISSSTNWSFKWESETKFIEYFPSIPVYLKSFLQSSFQSSFW